jgi:hypothetical protein
VKKNELESWIEGKKVPSGELCALSLKRIKKQNLSEMVLMQTQASVMATNL